MEKKWKIIIILIIVIIPIIIGFSLKSANALFSWFFIEFWLFFTFIFLKKIKTSREFNSPHNTSFFLFGPLSIGTFYTIWGYFAFTGFPERNLVSSPYYLSSWNVFLAFPYILYGLFSLNSCFRKHDLIYIYKNKSVKARPLAFLYSIFLFIMGITFLVLASGYRYLFSLDLTHSNIDLLLLLTIIIDGLLLFAHGFIIRKPALPEISPDLISRRRRQLDRMSTPITRTSPSRQRIVSASTSRSTPRREKPRTTSSRASRSTARSKTTSQRPRTPTARASRSSTSRATSISPQRYVNLLPKAGILSLEDFKCIFCFNLPKLPADKGRGIVLCPNCKHPAHADEFKDWLKSSVLCSRCDTPIPPRDRRDPKIISVKEYSAVIKEFSKKKKR